MSIDLSLSAAPRVSVIIPSSTRHDLLHACLRSLARFGPATIPYETIVVLNQATHEAEARLQEVATGVRVTSSPVNLGLAGAGNRGRALARGDLLILLHDDAEIEPGWMEALVETADSYPEAGAIGGKVLYPDGQLQFAGAILWQNGICSFPWVGEWPPPTAFNRLRAVDFCGTSSLLVRAGLWDFVGGLDEQFYPVYYVDVDLAMALRKLGFVVLYQPK
jgi:GT2 family glycosyltransferase